jgi:hypothetical protein
MVIKYTNIYHSKALRNLPKFGIFGLKTNHQATLVTLWTTLLLIAVVISAKQQSLKNEAVFLPPNLKFET